MAAVQLEELNEQNSDVDVGTPHVLPIVKLRGGKSLLASHVLTDLSVYRESFPRKEKLTLLASHTDLQEADSHEEETVGTNPTSKNLIQVPLQ